MKYKKATSFHQDRIEKKAGDVSVSFDIRLNYMYQQRLTLFSYDIIDS